MIEVEGKISRLNNIDDFENGNKGIVYEGMLYNGKIVSGEFCISVVGRKLVILIKEPEDLIAEAEAQGMLCMDEDGNPIEPSSAPAHATKGKSVNPFPKIEKLGEDAA